jgi:hypothetical protein
MAEFRSLFRCYDPRFLVEIIVLFVAYAAATMISARFDPGSSARIACGVAAASALAAIILGMILRIRRLDELQRQIQFEATGIAFGASIALITGAGILHRAGAIAAVDWGLWAWPLMFVSWSFALAAVQRRYA